MERYTIRNEEASSIPLIADPYLHPAENGYAGLAAERLAKLEILYEQLTAQQETLAKELEALRLAGKNPHDKNSSSSWPKSSRIKTSLSCWTPMFLTPLWRKNNRLETARLF